MSHLVPLDEALQAARDAGDFSRWPGRTPGNRLEPEAWPVMQPRFRIPPACTIFTIGSCFARNIEEYMFRLGFKVPTLGFRVPVTEWKYRANGLLNRYTPASIFHDLAWTQRILSRGTPFTAADAEPLIETLADGSCVDLQLGGFVPVTRARAVARRQELFELFAQAFSADVVTITLGLVEGWWDASRGIYVQDKPSRAMTQARPDNYFFKSMGFEESRDFVFDAIELLVGTGNPDKKILITTSPVPLRRSFTGQDVLMANMYSKCLLRTIAGMAPLKYPQVDYFPSFESVMLSRAPDVWEDDLVHVSDGFIAKIVGRLVENYVEGAQQASGDVNAVQQARAAFAAEEYDAARALLDQVGRPDALPPELQSVHAFLHHMCTRLGHAPATPAPALQPDVGALFKKERFQYAELLIEWGENDAAEEILRSCIEQREHAASALRALFRLLDGDNRHQEIIELIKQQLEVRPGSAQHFGQLGKSYLKLGDEALALEAFVEAARLRPEVRVWAEWVKRLTPAAGLEAG